MNLEFIADSGLSQDARLRLKLPCWKCKIYRICFRNYPNGYNAEI